MDSDLKELEEQIVRLIALCDSLRDENVQLREKSAELKSNMEQASIKLEALLGQLPNDKEVA